MDDASRREGNGQSETKHPQRHKSGDLRGEFEGRKSGGGVGSMKGSKEGQMGPDHGQQGIQAEGLDLIP